MTAYLGHLIAWSTLRISASISGGKSLLIWLAVAVDSDSNCLERAAPREQKADAYPREQPPARLPRARRPSRELIPVTNLGCKHGKKSPVRVVGLEGKEGKASRLHKWLNSIRIWKK